VRDVDDLAVRQVVLELLDPTLAERLLLASRVVLGVLAQVAVGTGLRDRLDDAWPFDPLEPLEFLAQALCTLLSQWLTSHI
jgi:hypothetical protein